MDLAAILAHGQLYQQLIFARDDIQVRDRAMERSQLQHSQQKSSFEQVLTTFSELIALHVTLLEQLQQHVHLIARLNVSTSAVKHYRNQLLEFHTTTSAELSVSHAQLQEVQDKYDELVAQVSKEDSLFYGSIESLRRRPHVLRWLPRDRSETLQG